MINAQDILFEGQPKKELMEDIRPFMWIIMSIHIFDWLITSIEREAFKCLGRYNPFIFYRYNDPFLFNKFSEG